jgi:hypothetical protein
VLQAHHVQVQAVQSRQVLVSGLMLPLLLIPFRVRLISSGDWRNRGELVRDLYNCGVGVVLYSVQIWVSVTFD